MSSKNKRHNSESTLFIIMGLIIIGLIISGYMLFVGKILPELAKVNEKANEMPKTVVKQHQKSSGEKAAELLPPEQAQAIRVYFPIKGSDKLNSEIRKVRKSKMLLSQAEEVLEVIMSGPESNEMYSPFPEHTKVRAVYFYNNEFIVDLSNEVKKSSINGLTDDMLMIYSIVDSLTELNEKAKVRFLVNGTELATLHGHLDLSKPFLRNDNLIKG